MDCPVPCDHCGKFRHYYRNCPVAHQEEVGTNAHGPFNVAIVCAAIPEFKKSLALREVKLYGRTATIGFDSLSCANLVSEEYLRKQQMTFPKRDVSRTFEVDSFAGTGTTRGTVSLPVVFAGNHVDHIECEVVEKLPGPISLLVSWRYMVSRDVRLVPSQGLVQYHGQMVTDTTVTPMVCGEAVKTH